MILYLGGGVIFGGLFASEILVEGRGLLLQFYSIERRNLMLFILGVLHLIFGWREGAYYCNFTVL